MKYAALAVHKSFSQVCVLDREEDTCLDFRIDSSRESVRELWELLSETEAVALEASSHWGWVVDELDGMGLDVVLSHPSKTKVMANSSTSYTINGGVVSATFNGFFYVQTEDRTTGMRVEMANHGRAIGEKLNIVGTLSSTSTGERRILATSLILNPY